MDNFQQKFTEEATDLLNNLEESLLKLEKQKDDKEMIAAVFRIMHSLKGGGSMFGFDAISNFTHDMETIYDEVRNDRLKISEELLSVSFLAVDHMRNLLDVDALKDKQINKNHNILLKRVQVLLEGIDVDTASNQKEEHATTTDGDTLYFIRFVPNEDVMDNGTNPMYIVDELCDLGTNIVFPNIKRIPSFTNNFNPHSCYISWDIFLSTKSNLEVIKDVFIFVEEDSHIEIEKIASRNFLTDKSIAERITNEYNSLQEPNVDSIKNIFNAINQENQQKKVTEKEKIRTFTKEAKISSVRVDSDKIDQLMNLVSELVTTQARLSLFVEKNKTNELNQISENVENVTRQLRETAFSISLIPIETMLTRFHRLIRDLSAEFHKNIEFITEGAETELDKTLVQGLTDPLMHIIRNSIDHGIELEEERIAKGKTPQGMIYLKAFYSSSSVVIKVQDDGRGIDLDKIRSKAIERGIIENTAQLTDKEILDLTFVPGFSTAENVTDISGRGVGMDVVKRKINEIRGSVEVETKRNIGTTTTIKLPLTLSIVDGLLVSIDSTKYLIPLHFVEKIFAFKHEELDKAFNNLITIESEQIPFYKLREEFLIEGEAPQEEKLIKVKYEDKTVGLIVDKVIGEYQAVLKPLGKLYMNNDILSGATILGDGTIALVLDTNKIINEYSVKY